MRIDPEEVIKWLGVGSLLASLVVKHFKSFQGLFRKRKKPCKHQSHTVRTARQNTVSHKRSKKKP